VAKLNMAESTKKALRSALSTYDCAIANGDLTSLKRSAWLLT
jgi:hypothetical protein